MNRDHRQCRGHRHGSIRRFICRSLARASGHKQHISLYQGHIRSLGIENLLDVDRNFLHPVRRLLRILPLLNADVLCFLRPARGPLGR